MVEMEYVAFISYRHLSPDMEVAQKLHTAIETYRIPGNVRRKSGRTKTGRVFRDQEELPLSADLGKDIETALDHSEWFIAVCSPRYPQSRWCMRELEYFIEKKGRSHVLTVLVEDEPENSFPDLLLYEDDGKGNRVPVEPLAADVRGATTAEMLKKLKAEKLRLLAPILNVTYDDLRLRERQRRKKQIAAAAAIVLAAAGTLTGILLRNAALREEALQHQRTALNQHREATSNSIGESLLESGRLLDLNDNRRSAQVLLDALAVSEENEDLRRDDILSALRKTMYIEPFSIVSRLDLQNLQTSSARISPDGKKLICISNSNSVVLVDLDTNKTVFTVSNGSAETDEIAFSPDGSRFLTICDFYHYVTVWDAESGEKIYTYTSRTDEQKKVSGALFWKDSDTLLVQDGDQFFRVSVPDGTAELFYTVGDEQEDYDSSKALHSFRIGVSFEEIQAEFAPYKHLLVGYPVQISPDGEKVLVTGQLGDTGSIVLNDRGERIALLDRMPGFLADRYDISPDGTYISCQASLGFVAIWEAETGKLRCMRSLDFTVGNGTTAPVFSPDSSTVAFVLEKNLYLMDAPNGVEMTAIPITWEEDFPPEIHWSDDGKYLIVMTPDLYMVDTKTRSLLLSCTATGLESFNNAVPAGDRYVFVTRENGEAVLYSLPGISSIEFRASYDGALAGEDVSQRQGKPWDNEPAGEHQMNDLSHILTETTDIAPEKYYSPDGAYAALLYHDGAVEIFRREDSSQVYLLNRQFYEMPNEFGIISGNLVAAENPGGIMFQNLEDQRITTLNTDTLYTNMRFRGNLLMAVQDNGCTIDVFDIVKAEQLFSMQSAVPFESFGFSEDGNETVAFIGENECLAANLWADEDALLEKARTFASGN